MRNSSRLFLLFCAALAFQTAVLTGEYLTSVYPIWSGKEVALAITPVDPRSLFRGQYAQLAYDIGMIKKSAFGKETGALRYGETVYVSLKEKDGVWTAAQAGVARPSEGTFIRGRVDSSHWGDNIRIRYGIEAFFASPERASKVENDLRGIGFRLNHRTAVAKVMLAPNGKAALVGVDTKNLRKRTRGSIIADRTRLNNAFEIKDRINEHEFATSYGPGNSAFCRSCPQVVSGAHGTHLRFDGSTTSLMVPHDWRLSSQDITVSGWVKIDDPAQKESTILSRQTPGRTSGYALRYVNRADGQAGFEFSLADHQQQLHSWFYPTAVAAGSWHFVAFSRSSSESVFLIDGVKRSVEYNTVGDKERVKGLSANRRFAVRHIQTPLVIGGPVQGAHSMFRGELARLSILGESLSETDLIALKDEL